MTTDLSPRLRTRARRAALAATLLSAAALGGSTWALLDASVAVAAATRAGDLQVVAPNGTPSAGQPLSEGGSATVFSLAVPLNAACASDGENGGRWHTYMVPEAEDDAAVAFAATGSVVGNSLGTGGSGTFRNNLFSTSSTAVRNQAPSLGDARVINIPNLSFDVFEAGNVPAGTYTVGIACVDVDGGITRDAYWNTRLAVTADDTDPKGFRWQAVGPAATTTTTPSTTSTTVATTTSTTSGETTTTEGSTTTIDDTTTTTDDGTSTTAPFGGGGDVLGGSADATGGGSGGFLPATGAGVGGLIASALALTVFGRMGILLGRPTPVVDQDP